MISWAAGALGLDLARLPATKSIMDWYCWYPADYKADTMHLTAEQDGIYRRLIDFYMETKQPLPDSDNALARAAGVDREQWTDSAAAIRPFFTLKKDSKLHLKRCDIEIARQHAQKSRNSFKGKKGAKARWGNSDNNQIANSSSYSSAIAEPMPNDSRGEKRREESKNPLKLKNPQNDFQLPDAIGEQDWNDYEQMRKRIRKPMTGRARKLAVSKLLELQAEGHSPASVLQNAVFNSYQGLYPPNQPKGKDYGQQSKWDIAEKNILAERALQNDFAMLDDALEGTKKLR